MITVDIDELMKEAKDERKVEVQPTDTEQDSNAAQQLESEGNHQSEERVEENKDNKDNDVVNEEPDVNEKSDNGENQTVDNTNDSSKNKSKSKYTQQEKINHSFSKLKAKNKAKIEQLQNEVANLKKELEQYQNKTVDDFKSQEEYLDARQDARWNLRELEKRNNELKELQNEQIIERNQNRFNTLYATDEEKQSYIEAWNIGKQNGVLEAINNDRVIMEFLNDSDYGPKLLEHFIRRPDVLERFISIENTGRKNHELYSLEDRLVRFLNSQHNNNAKENSEHKSLLVENKKSNSIIGKQIAKSDTIKSNDDFASDDDVFAFIRNH